MSQTVILVIGLSFNTEEALYILLYAFYTLMINYMRIKLRNMVGAKIFGNVRTLVAHITNLFQ